MRPLQQTHSAFSESAEIELVSCSLFKNHTAGLNVERKHRFLDFGPAEPTIIEFFSRFPCRLTLWDLSGEIPRLGNEPDNEDTNAAIEVEALLDFDSDESYDLVLCWDLLNYLDEPYLIEFAQQLAGRLRPGGVVHGFMSASNTVPAEPARYTLLDDARMQRRFSSSTRSIPRVYYQQQLQRVLSPLVVAKAVLLRNGMQEYLFKRR
jgi:2-polyprenyl-3-methyl-5-hydroxy-6-metoxy-1,4-benzoquinol methylase